MRRSASAIYPSKPVTWKQVWVKRRTCSVTASTTKGALDPTFSTAIPAPRSMNELPSTSTTMPPYARSAKIGIVAPTLAGTDAFLRAASSSDRGPGMAVRTSRTWGTSADSNTITTCRSGEHAALRGSFLASSRSSSSLEPQRIGERVGDQRFRQSMSFAVRSRATARAS